jgi:hypothetical protein
VAYINRSAPPGSATASEQALPHGSIAGWPSYYWILPEQNQIVRLQPAGRIRNRGSGLPALRNYLKSYLETYSSFTEITPLNSNDHDSDSSTITVQGWRVNPNAPLHSDVSARFQTVLLNKPSMRDAILTRWQDVRKRIHSVQVTRHRGGRS